MAARIAHVEGEGVVVRRVADKAFVNLREAAHCALGGCGIEPEDIEDVPGCTCCDAVRHYSFRRDGDASGRHIAVIVARDPR